MPDLVPAVNSTMQCGSFDGAPAAATDPAGTTVPSAHTPVPEPLGIILTELIRTGRTHTGTGSPLTTPWLFPGGLPGQPITASGSASA